jgi:hypothetical protein
MITKNEKGIMRSIIMTMVYNNFNDLKDNFNREKDNLSEPALELLMFGDKHSVNGRNRVISELEGRWCLKSILEYHRDMTKKITIEQYNSFFCF